MKRLKSLFIIPIAMLLTYCASTKPEPKYFDDGIVNLAGMWVLSDQKQESLDILLGIDLNENSTDLFIMGEQVKNYQMKTLGNQFLISYETLEGRLFNILAQMKNENEMRISRTEEAVKSFMPIGQLGESVFHLKRLNSKQALMASSNKKVKNDL